jgi:hypothetical protein
MALLSPSYGEKIKLCKENGIELGKERDWWPRAQEKY